MKKSEILMAAESVADIFEKLGIPYYIGGSLASSVYEIWFRLGGEVSDRQWKDILGVLKIQKKTLDKKYLQTWAYELNISDLLEKSFHDADFDD